MRPEDPGDSCRIAAGVLKSIQKGGYDYPVRKMRRSGNSTIATLPLQVLGFLDVKGGDWLTFGATPWRGVAAFIKVTADQYDRIAADGRKDFRKLARKVQARKRGVIVAIPPAICKLLSAEVGDSLIFGLTPTPGVISIAAIKGGGNSAGSRRSG